MKKSGNSSGDFQSPEDINGERSSPLRLRWRTEFSTTITMENGVLHYHEYDMINFVRKSNRYKEYDYSKSAGYFITICSKDMKCLFANIDVESVAVNSVHQNPVPVNSVHQNPVPVNSVHQNPVAVNSVHQNLVAVNSVHQNPVPVNSVHQNSVAVNSVHQNPVPVNSVHQNPVAVNSVHQNSVAVNSVHQNSVAVNSVHQNSVAVNSVHQNLYTIVEDKIIYPAHVLTEMGKMIETTIISMFNYNPLVVFDIYVIMPNHIHFIILLLDEIAECGERSSQLRVSKPSIPNLVRYLKSSITKQCGYSVWQNSYYDHILRDYQDYDTKYQYILYNPLNWINDKYFTKP